MTISQRFAHSRSTSRASSHWLYLGIVTIVALLLRIVAINEHSFWYDEAIASQLSHASISDLFRGIARDSGNPPLYWIILHIWQNMWGNSEPALRSLSVIFGVAAVPLLAILGQKLFNPLAGLMAAGLLAISPLCVELSNEARVYAMLHFLTIVSMLLFFSWIQRRNRLTFFAYAISVAALCYSHYFAFYIPIAQGISLLVVPEWRKHFLSWLGAMAFAALLWLPWMPIFLHQIHSPGNMARMGGRWPMQFAATPTEMVFGRTLAWRGSSLIILSVVTLAAILLVWIPSVFGLLGTWRKQGERVAVGTWLWLPIAIPFLLALTLTPLYHVRAGSVGLPALLLLAGAGIASLRPKVRVMTAIAILLFTTVSLARYATIPLKDDWRDAVPVVLANLPADQPIVFDTFIEHASFMYYADMQHATPREMIGLTSAPTPQGICVGISFRNGQRIDTEPRNCNDDIFTSSGAWLALCVPAGNYSQYDALFVGHGFELDQQAHFKRVDLYHYVRKASAR